MSISLIVAIAENGVMGRGGKLPWHLPKDLERFKRLTSGHTVVMGRKTYDSIGNPLPNRHNVVLTRNRDLSLEGVEIVHELTESLATSEEEGGEIFVIGGAEVFAGALPHADRIYLTLVHTTVEGETVFAGFETSEWELLEDEFHDSDAEHQHSFSFRVYERR